MVALQGAPIIVSFEKSSKIFQARKVNTVSKRDRLLDLACGNSQNLRDVILRLEKKLKLNPDNKIAKTNLEEIIKLMQAD